MSENGLLPYLDWLGGPEVQQEWVKQRRCSHLKIRQPESGNSHWSFSEGSAVLLKVIYVKTIHTEWYIGIKHDVRNLSERKRVRWPRACGMKSWSLFHLAGRWILSHVHGDGTLSWEKAGGQGYSALWSVYGRLHYTGKNG